MTETRQPDRLQKSAERLPLPTTPAGRQLAAYLAVHNTGDRAAMERFIDDTYDLTPGDAWPPVYHRWLGATLFAKTGGLRPVSIEESSPHRIVVRASMLALPCLVAHGLSMMLEVAPQPPHKIIRITVWPAPLPTSGWADVGGRRLAYTTAGAGSPTVVLEAGFGWAREAWVWIHDSLAQMTTVTSYDRAGLGLSDPGPTPRTAADVAHDLHHLLTATALPGPYLLVGHSFGGDIIRLFAHCHPDTVCGLVFIDAAHPETEERWRTLLPRATEGEPPPLAGLRRWLIEECYDPAKNGERIDLPRSEAQVAAATLPDAVLLTILTAGQSAWDWTGIPQDVAVQMDAVWQELQRDHLRLSSRSTQIMAAQSGHNIFFDEPALVIAAIRAMVDTIRAARDG